MTDNSGLSTVALAQWVRPTRMAVLVPIVDDWEALALHVLAINTGIWGGSGNIVVPYDPVSGEIDDAILALVRRFDPDVWGDYHHTGRALELDDPARFESIVRERSPGHEHDRQWLELIRKDLRDAAWVAGAPPKLLSGLVKFSSPAWDRQYGRPAYLSTDTHPQHEAGLLVDAAQLGSLPDPLIVMNLGALPVDLRLLIASRFGAMNPRLVGALGRRDVPIFDVEVAADEEDRVRRVGWGLDGGGDWSLGYQLAVYRADYPTFAPYRLSETGLANFTVLTPHAHEAPVPVVVGDSFNDFAYAHALERDLGVALWLPGRLLPPAGQEHPGRARPDTRPATPEACRAATADRDGVPVATAECPDRPGGAAQRLGVIAPCHRVGDWPC